MARNRRLSFNLPLFPYDRWGGIEPIARIAQRAEALGYAGLIFPDHVIMPRKTGVPPVSSVWYDNFVLATHIAALTRRIRLIFNVLVVPYRPAILLAKLVSTLDVVSGGRLTLGVGTGWLQREFEALNVPYAERGAITDETLRAMKVLWTEEHPSFEGRYTSFSEIAFEPKCLQRPHVKLWIGGTGAAPLRRAVELGDGWSPMRGELPELEGNVRWIQAELSARGRDAADYDFASSISFGERDALRERARSHAAGATQNAPVVTSAGELIALIEAHRSVGFNQLGVSFAWATPEEYLEKAEWFATAIMPAFAGACAGTEVSR